MIHCALIASYYTPLPLSAYSCQLMRLAHLLYEECDGYYV